MTLQSLMSAAVLMAACWLLVLLLLRGLPETLYWLAMWITIVSRRVVGFLVVSSRQIQRARRGLHGHVRERLRDERLGGRSRRRKARSRLTPDSDCVEAEVNYWDVRLRETNGER